MAQKEQSFTSLQPKGRSVARNIIPFISHISFRKYPLSCICIALIWILALTPLFPETPLSNVEFADKWTHFVMYGGTCSVIWWEHLRHCKKEARKRSSACGQQHIVRFSLFTLIFLTALGGLMELLQAYCTTTRSGEWLDFLADTLGVILGTALGFLMKKLLPSTPSSCQ